MEINKRDRCHSCPPRSLTVVGGVAVVVAAGVKALAVPEADGGEGGDVRFAVVASGKGSQKCLKPRMGTCQWGQQLWTSGC